MKLDDPVKSRDREKRRRNSRQWIKKKKNTSGRQANRELKKKANTIGCRMESKTRKRKAKQRRKVESKQIECKWGLGA